MPLQEKIKIEADQVEWNNSDSVIFFYEKHHLYFENFQNLEEEELLFEFIDIKLLYIASLINKGRLKKAMSFITDVDILNQKIVEHPNFPQFEERKDFYQGMIYAYLKNYSQAADIFNKLLKVDPENDNYKDWYTNMRIHGMNKLTWGFAILGLIVMFVDIGYHAFFHIHLSEFFGFFGIGLVVISLLFPYVYRFLIKTKITWK